MNVELLFLGTGTSAGIPMIGCHCPVCTSSDPRDKRHRPSVLVEYNGKKILVDTTPELRLQCLQYNIDMIDAIVFTHAHADHIMGLDDVRRFNAISKKPMDVWMDAKTADTVKRCFGYAFLDATVNTGIFRPQLIHRLIEGPFDVQGVKWTPVPLIHGKVDVLGFRIGNLAYCTDVSAIPESSFELLRGLEVLVLDGLQEKKHPTHLSYAESVEAANRIGAKMTWLTHLSHGHNHVDSNAMLPKHVQLGYDGQRLTASL